MREKKNVKQRREKKSKIVDLNTNTQVVALYLIVIKLSYKTNDEIYILKLKDKYFQI